jgi:hypothetical protein
MGLFVTLDIKDTQQNNTGIMLIVVMLSVMLKVIMLCVIMLNVIMLNVVMLNVIMLSVVMLSSVMLSVMARVFSPLSKVIKNYETLSKISTLKLFHFDTQASIFKNSFTALIY